MKSEENIQKPSTEDSGKKPEHEKDILEAGETPIVITGGSFQISSGLTFEDDDGRPGHRYRIPGNGDVKRVLIIDGGNVNGPIVINDPKHLTILITYYTPA